MNSAKMAVLLLNRLNCHSSDIHEVPGEKGCQVVLAASWMETL